MNPRYSRYYIFIKPVLKNRLLKNYGYFIFSLLTITIFALFAIRPTFSTIVSLEKSITEQKKILEQLNIKIAGLSEGKKNLESLDQDVSDKLSSLMPDSTSLPKLIDILTGLAAQNEASLSGLQFQPVELYRSSKPTKNSKAEEIEFTLNTQGTYPQLMGFLNDIVTSRRLVNIKSVNFNKTIETPLSMSITAVAFFMKN